MIEQIISKLLIVISLLCQNRSKYDRQQDSLDYNLHFSHDIINNYILTNLII